MKPAALRGAVVLAVVAGALGLVAAAIGVARAGHNADVFVRHHPDQSHAVGLAGSYVFAGVAFVLSGLYFFGAWRLHNRRRSGWVLLLVLAGLGFLGVFTTRTVLGALSLVPDLALLACLLARSTRATFQQTPHAA